jgi:hypothetical protein
VVGLPANDTPLGNVVILESALLFGLISAITVRSP